MYVESPNKIYVWIIPITPNRKDGCRKVFEWYIGPMAYVSKDKNTDYVKVDILKYILFQIQNTVVLKLLTEGKPCCPRMIDQ